MTDLQKTNESKPSLTRETVQTSETIKFRDVTEPKQFHALALKLRVANMMVKGNNIEQLQENILVKFITDGFKDMSAVDVEQAVNLHLMNKLGCDTTYCVKMSGEYFGVILAAYRVFKRNAEAEKRKAIPVSTEVKILTDEENYFEICNYIERNSKLPEWGSNIYLSAYNHLIELVYTPTDEEKKDFAKGIKNKKQQQIDFLKTQGLSQNIRAEINKLTNEISRPVDFANHCRVEYIKNYLTKKYSL